jgi:hypothetical protein
MIILIKSLTFLTSILSQQLIAKEKERDLEIQKLRTQSAEAKEQIQGLKDDNTRKAQLLARMKEAKISDNEALDAATRTATDAELNNKRYIIVLCVFG